MAERARTAPADFDEIHYHYEESIDPLVQSVGGEPHDYYLQLKANELLAHLGRLGADPSRARALDVGCGTGRFVELLHGRLREIKGVEPSRGMLEAALRRGLPEGTFLRGHAESVPFADGAFDAVFSSCIFHHTPAASHVRMASEMARTLKPGGWLFAFEHNPLNPLTRWIVSRCAVDVGVTLHRGGRLERVFRDAGLSRVHTRYIVFFPSLLKALRPLEPFLHSVPLGGQYYVCAQKAAQARFRTPFFDPGAV